MEANTRPSEQPSSGKQEAFKKLMELLDARVDDPQKRASKVLFFLQSKPDISNYDMVCFAVEILAANIDMLQPVKTNLKTVVKFVYNQHYLVGDEIGLWELSEEEKLLKAEILR